MMYLNYGETSKAMKARRSYVLNIQAEVKINPKRRSFYLSPYKIAYSVHF